MGFFFVHILFCCFFRWRRAGVFCFKVLSGVSGSSYGWEITPYYLLYFSAPRRVNTHMIVVLVRFDIVGTLVAISVIILVFFVLRVPIEERNLNISIIPYFRVKSRGSGRAGSCNPDPTRRVIIGRPPDPFRPGLAREMSKTSRPHPLVGSKIRLQPWHFRPTWIAALSSQRQHSSSTRYTPIIIAIIRKLGVKNVDRASELRRVITLHTKFRERTWDADIREGNFHAHVSFPALLLSYYRVSCLIVSVRLSSPL